MQKNKIHITSIVLFLIVLLTPLSTHALTITEIMYDVAGTDTGREWVEVFNGGTQSVDVKTYKLFESNVNHGITTSDSYTNPSATLPVGGYAVIADNAVKFLEDWPQYTGYLFDSAFSLSNTGELLRMVDASGGTTDTREYSPELGAKGDGASLQFLEGAFVASIATPGALNVWKPVDVRTPVSSAASTSTTPNTSISTHESQIELISAVEKTTIKVSAGRDRLTSVHAPLSFSGATFDNSTAAKISFHWNFGDGNTGKGRVIEHSYESPGVYNVVLNAIAGKERAVSRSEITVIDPSLKVESATTSIVIHNNGPTELNIGDFILKSSNGTYVLPKDTILKAGSVVPFSRNVFPKIGTSTVELLFPNKKSI
jgi:hypothetical protein